jgi:hypothetical protein
MEVELFFEAIFFRLKKSGNEQPDPKLRGGTTKQSDGSRPKIDFG